MSRLVSVFLGVGVAAVATIALMLLSPGPPIWADQDHDGSRGRQDRNTKKVLFGLVGEAFDPPGAGGGATRDRVEPPLIFIKDGRTLKFINRSGGTHQIAIYKDATGAVTNFVDVGYPAPSAPAPNANYIEPPDGSARPANRIAGGLGPSPVGVSTADRQAGAIDFTYTFSTPGQYLVICNFRPHFVDFGMATFVIVDETIP